jgi:hypothetical protein
MIPGTTMCLLAPEPDGGMMLISAVGAGAVGVTTAMLETFMFMLMCGADPLATMMLVGMLTGADGAADALLVALIPESEATLETDPGGGVTEVSLPEG